jgi:thiol:disulfide interchange protein DsbC
MPPFILAASLVGLFPAAAAPDASVQETLAARFPGVEAENVRPTPVPGLWEVAVGAQVVYLSEDGRFLLRGELIDLMTSESLTDSRRAELVGQMTAKLDESRMVVFSPEKPRHTITVLTDIDCGYCRRFHREIDEYNQRGIKVRYLFYPLAGPGSPSWAKADAVWCSADRQDAMTRAKAGEEIKPKLPCENTPVTEHYQLAGQLGATGTPALLLSDGTLVPGYVPPDQLAAWLDNR